MIQLYKFLNEDGTPCNGGTGPAWTPPGEWMPPVVGDLAPCRNGYHLCAVKYLPPWIGPVLWTAEAGDDHIVCNDKIVCRTARRMERIKTWNERTQRLFAADCAEHVLPGYLASKPEDGGMAVMLCLHVIREFDEGRADQDDLAAARDAAWAAWDAARYAARYAARDAAWAAWDAARYAARDAAWAAWAAWDTARDAAGAAARAAAGAAAWSTGAAAKDAADAARAAAKDAAGVAERQWQVKRLCEYLEIEL